MTTSSFLTRKIMNSRSVSFVDRLELEFSGNHFCHALTLGDIDGDGLNEFIIGNVEGDLSIYKGCISKRPWKQATGLGTITCVGTGDVLNSGKIQLICINDIGMCYIFSVYKQYLSVNPSSSNLLEATIEPVYSQKLLANIRVLLVAGIGIEEKVWKQAPDGKEELFVGHTDRFIRVYRWDPEHLLLELRYTFNLEGQIGSLSVTMTTNGTFQLLVSQVGGTYIPLMYVELLTNEASNSGDATGSSAESSDLRYDRDSMGISMSLEENKETKVKRGSRKSSKLESEQSPLQSERKFQRTISTNSTGTTIQGLSSATPTYTVVDGHRLVVCPLVGQVQRRNPTSLTEVVGDLKYSRVSLIDTDPHSNIVALCTLDGCIRFIKDDKKVWEHLVDHHLFAIAKLDITNDGNDEIIACSWDGFTYILDHSRNVVKYKFEDNVCAFCAGHYGFGSEHNKPCLIYSTFFNKIYIYYNITLSSVSPSNLMIALAQKDTPEYILKHLQCLTGEEKRDLVRKVLYSKLSLSK